jgi:hypothetical protein
MNKETEALPDAQDFILLCGDNPQKKSHNLFTELAPLKDVERF